VKSYDRLRIGNAHYSLSQDSYIQSRSTAIESIESTIAELGQIFTQLAQMVAEQRETVQRIDADTVDIASNVSGAQRELLKYYASISSNRWLMLKVFGVLIVFVSPSNFHVYRKFDTATVPYLHPGVLRHQRSTTYHYMHILFA
jgi:t-SNARE complex subunit (syntaxin)